MKLRVGRAETPGADVPCTCAVAVFQRLRLTLTLFQCTISISSLLVSAHFTLFWTQTRIPYTAGMFQEIKYTII
jgi:hypothetical protein